MDADLRIVYEEHPEQSAWGVIGRGVGEHNRRQAGDPGGKRLCYVLADREGEVVGGVVAELQWDWLYVDLLWVREDLRGRGFGGRLLESVEDDARRRGARRAYLDTFSFQAPEFYKRYGYGVFGELPDFPPGHRRYYLTKQL